MKEGKFDARVYRVKQNWTLEVVADGLNTQVFRIKNGKREGQALIAHDTKTYEINLESPSRQEQARDMIQTFGQAIGAVAPIAGPAILANCNVS